MKQESQKIIGNIEEIKNGYLYGWLATEELQQIFSRVSVSANDVDLGNVNEFHYRVDLEEAGIAGGVAAFELDISDYLDKLKGLVTFTFSIAGDEIYEASLRVPNTTILNNPDCQTWRVKVDHRLGYYVEDFYSSHHLLDNFSTYSRYSFLSTEDTGKELAISVPLSNVPAELTIGSLSCCLIVRSDRLCTVMLELHCNNAKVAFEPLNVYTTWSKSLVNLIDQELSLQNENDYKLIVKFPHHGRSYLDVGFCGVGEAPDSYQPVQDKTKAQLNEHEPIHNGCLDDWSNGANFNPLVRGMELADNWFFECAKGNEDKIFINVETYHTNNDPLVFDRPQSLIRVRTKQLEGYARLVLPVNLKSLSYDQLNLTIAAIAQGLGRKTTISSVNLVARTSTKDHFIHTLAKNIVIEDSIEKVIGLDAAAMIRLRKKLKDFPSLVLAIELGSNVDVGLKKVVLNKNSEDTVLADTVSDVIYKAEKLSFEDDSINEQLQLIKGLEIWNELVLDVQHSKGAPSNEYNDSIINRLSKTSVAKINQNSDLPTVDIIVPVFNAHDDVLNCLTSVLEKTTANYSIIIVDDGSDEETKISLEALSALYPHVTLLRHTKNQGYTKAVNAGLKNSIHNWKVVLNSDTVVTKDWIENLMNCALSDKKVGMVGALSNAASWQSIPEIFDADGSSWNLNPIPEKFSIQDVADLVAKHSAKSYPEVGVINGFCQLINGEMLNEIGLLDEKAFPVGFGEENDMCARAVKAGYKLLIADNVYIYHAKSKSFGHGKRKLLSKKGAEALKVKHSDVDWGKVTEKIKQDATLNALRSAIAREFNDQGQI